MGETFPGGAPVTDLRFLRSFLGCVLVNETYNYFTKSTLSPHFFITLYDSLCNSGSVIEGVLSESILILLIYFVEVFYRSTSDLTYLGGLFSIPFMSCVLILGLLTPDPLLLGCRYFRRLAFSLDFSFVSR